MKELVIKGEFHKKNKLVGLLLAIAAVCLVFSVICHFLGINGKLDYVQYDASYLFPLWKADALNFWHFEVFIPFYLTIILLVIALIQFLKMGKCELAITQKRIKGKTSFGKIVDLPVDMISSVSMEKNDSISISTSSDTFCFWLLENRQEVYDAITDIISNRQTNTTKNDDSHIGEADELKKYKDLLDSGVISQKEFDAKKEQLLGL